MEREEMAGTQPQGVQGKAEGRVTGSGIDRRTLVRRGALVAGTAWAAPLIHGSFASPAAAASGPLTTTPAPPTRHTHTEDTYNGAPIEVEIPAGSAVQYVISGAGGGGGGATIGAGGTGGAGTELTGTIPAQGSAYTLYLAVGQRGNRGVNPVGAIEQDKGLSLYGSGGLGAGVLGMGNPGRGGGGGGATAISNNSSFTGSILAVAPGGGGGGGKGLNKDTGITTPTSFCGVRTG